MIDSAKCPQLAKMQDAQSESQAVGAFIEWLRENKMDVGHYVVREGQTYENFLPISEGTEQLLARHFDIDLKAVERERRAALAAHNAVVATKGGAHDCTASLVPTDNDLICRCTRCGREYA